MGDDITKFGPTRIYVRPYGSNEPWQELKRATIKLCETCCNVLTAEYRKPGKKRKELIRLMQNVGLLKKPKTTYRTNKDYFKKRRGK